MLPEAVNNLPPVLRPADPPARPLSELAGRFARRVVGDPADRVVSGVTVSTTDLHAGDVFVARFGPDGTTLPFATYLGGVASDTGYGVAVDASENAITTGYTQSSNFPVTEGAFQTHYGGGLIFDAFVAKVRTAGGVTPAAGGSGGGGGCSAAGTPWMALLFATALLTLRRRRR